MFRKMSFGAQCVPFVKIPKLFVIFSVNALDMLFPNKVVVD